MLVKKKNTYLFTCCLFLIILNCNYIYAQTKRNEYVSRPKVGVVLSGGGAKGIAHIAVLKTLEELEIPIDYIVGTSMGAIIGGLYAYGYTAMELDTLVRTIDWTLLLSDKAIRENISIIEKIYQDPYIFKLTYGDKSKSFMPSGIIKGQHLNNFFYTLTSQSFQYKNFYNFNIPFCCVAADIISGKEVILDSGNLATAMRASMSVPTVFQPIEYGDYLLVDGGILNNFPANIVKEMGADIVIGVDVGSHSAKSKSNIKDFMDVLNQTIFIHSAKLYQDNKDLCDVYIKPNLEGYSSFSFSATDSLIKRGEEAAELAIPKLKEIAKELSVYKKDTIEKRPYKPKNLVYISEIEYSGLNKYNKAFIDQYLQIENNSWVKLNDINAGIERLYGTIVFESVEYEFKIDTSNTDKNILNIKVKESPSNTLNVGLRFDNQRSVALLVGTTLRNLGHSNSRLTFDLEISQLPMFTADYIFTPNLKRQAKHLFWRPSLGIKYQFYNIRENLYRAEDEPNRRTSEFNVQGHNIYLYAQSNWKKNILGLGFSIEYNPTKEIISDNSLPNNNLKTNTHIYPYFYFLHDSYDNKYYPTKGAKINVIARFPYGINTPPSLSKSFFSIFAKIKIALPLSERFIIYPGAALGVTLFRTSSQIPLQHLFYQGGQANISIWNNVNFPGLAFAQSEGFYLWNLNMNFQAKIIKNLYLSVRGAVGAAEDDLNKVFTSNNIVYGGNIGISYKTPVGPVGISFETSNINPFGIFINVAYWF